MVRLTAELISRSASFINTLKQRELELRGNKIPIIENLGATQDQYDVLDLTDNEIKKLEGFPLLARLTSLFVSNNRITRIAPKLEESLPKLETLILTNNLFSNLSDIDPLASLSSLRFLSILDNPVQKKQHYRFYVLHKLPQLRVLDFKKIKQKERQEAERLFGGESGAKLAAEVRGGQEGEPSIEEVKALRERLERAIRSAKPEDVSVLEAAISAGKLTPAVVKLLEGQQ